MSSSNGGGTTKLLYWLLGLLTVALLSMAGSWANGVNKNVEKVPVLERRLDDFKVQQDRMEEKLDRLLQRGNR